MASTLQHRPGVLKARTSARRALRRLSGYIAGAVLSLLIVLGAGVAVTQTSWFKNWLRQKIVSQTAQYLNGELVIQGLSGNLFTGVALEGVALVHEGRTAVAMDRLTVEYSPLTMISEGVILDSVVLENPTILLFRDEKGWNVGRFVKTRQNTGGRGAPPITMEAVTLHNGRVVVNDRGRVVDTLTGMNARLRFAYEKPGIGISIAQLSAQATDTRIRSLAGDLRFDRGSIAAREVAIETDRSRLRTQLSYGGPPGRLLDIRLDADRLSLPELGRYFPPLSNIRLEPAVGLTARGTLDALNMNVDVASSAGSARGPLVGHFGSGPASLEGRLDVRDVNMEPILNRKEWTTRVSGRAQFNWRFTPAEIDFTFTSPRLEEFGYQASDVTAKGVFRTSDLRFDASGAAYGATGTTRAVFRFATPSRPLTYSLDGTFRDLDMRRLPERLAMPKLESRAAGTYQFEATGRDWRASGELAESMVEGARFDTGTVVSVESRNRQLSYSASGNVAWLDPRRFAVPLKMQWLDDERLAGSLTGVFAMEGSGRAIGDLVLSTKASLVDSTLGGARFPSAEVDFQMENRQIHADFAGPFENVNGLAFTNQKELADTTLNGSADMGVRITIPGTGPVELLEVTGTATLSPSTIAGMAIDSGQATGSFADRTADIKELALSGPDVKASAAGVLALGENGTSNLAFDVAVTNVDPLAKRFNRPAAGSMHIVGDAKGPTSDLAIAGTFGAFRLRYGTNVDALSLKSLYSVQLPDFDLARARVQADTEATMVTLAGHHLPRVRAKTIYEQKQLTFDANFEEDARALALGGRVIFHPDHDELHLRALNLTVGQTQWSMPQGQEATARRSGDSVTIENFALQRGDQRLSAAGTVAVGAGSANLANDLDVRLENIQVQDVNELLLGDRKLAGLLFADAEISGTRNDPIIRAQFTVTGGSVDSVAFNSLTGNARYSGRAVDLDVRLEQGPQTYVTAVGTVPIPDGPGATARTEEIDLAIKSSLLDIGLLQLATTQLTNLKGQFTADMRIGGRLESPQMSGLFETTNGAFTVVPTGVTYGNVIARLMFEGDRLLVDRFEMTDDDADRLVAIGELGIARRGVGHMNVQVSATDFKVLDNQFGSIEIETDLRLTGDAAQPTVTGEIRTGAGGLEVDRILDRIGRSPYRTAPTIVTAVDAGVPGPEVAPEKPRGLWDAATIDVRLRLPDDLMLRGRDMHASFSRVGLGDMNITVGGDLQIRKTPGGEPDLIGTVNVVRGFYDFQRRRFEVMRDSQIRFQGSHPIDPALQVDAQRMITGVTAIVNIRGTARQPLIRLSSQPPLDEADVLSLIIFNQPINQLGEGERLRLAERAGGLAVDFLASPLANSIADALDLDIFEIRATGTESGRPSIALGEQIGSRLFVSFRQGFGPEDYRQFSFEYRISQLLRLVSTVTQGTLRAYRTQRIDTTGVDLIMTITY